MKFVWELLAFFLVLNAAWLFAYSDNAMYVYIGFALMAVLMLYSLYFIAKIVNNYAAWNTHENNADGN